MIDLANGGNPNFICKLQLFTLFSGGIGKFPVRSKARVPNSLIEHFRSYIYLLAWSISVYGTLNIHFYFYQLKVKEESVIAEEDITKKLYKDYSLFKHELIKNLVF